VWEVEVTDEFVEWWSTLTIEQQEAVTDRTTCSLNEDQTSAVRSSTESMPHVISR
jgi:hypothetical protein